MQDLEVSEEKPLNPWRCCTAPMMDWSDRHCRFFWRLMTKHSRLYSEMVTTGALIHGNRQAFLLHHPQEAPLALQLGGNNPSALAECARMAEDAGYQEVNLNCGCPSDRVQEGRIGACLMAEPELVADCVDAMQSAVSIPITVKHRIGIDDQDSWEHLTQFVGTIAQAGCNTFIVHARKAWLKGLSPKQNREIPPLQYGIVTDLKMAFPHLSIVINGGITDLQEGAALLNQLDGIMLGREAYHNPFILNSVDSVLFGQPNHRQNRQQVIEAFIPYCEQQLADGVRLHHLTRHILGIFNSQPGGRLFRQHLSVHGTRPNANIQVLRDALNIQQEQYNLWQERNPPSCASANDPLN